MGGTAHLARYGEVFPLGLEPVLEALEEQVVLMRLLGASTSGSALTVTIGREHTIEGMGSTSVVAAPYTRGESTVASVGIVGPTHMDYPGTIASVQAVAQYLSRILGSA